MEGKIDNAEAELLMYSTFPLYPVCKWDSFPLCQTYHLDFEISLSFLAFLVACNVVLEISGNTSTIETYMNSTTSSGSVSLGYGPFSISASSSNSSTDTKSSCVTTASGCR